MQDESDIRRYHGAFKGREAFIVASGPSAGLTRPGAIQKFSHNRLTIGTNDVWRVDNGKPLECDFFVILDIKFYEDHWQEIFDYQQPRNSIPITFFPIDRKHLRIPIDMNWDANHSKFCDKIKYDPDRYFHGHSSGVAAVQFAMHAGCKKIYLLGHDLSTIPSRTHGFGTRQREKTGYEQGLTMRAGYDLLAMHARELGVDIINLSAISRLDQFKKKPELLK